MDRLRHLFTQNGGDENHPMNPFERLQHMFTAAVEEQFERDTQEAIQRSMHQEQQQQQRQGPPPASPKVVRQLPVVTVTAQDLIDPVNRECAICLEETCLKDRVVRLFCAHIYHPDCIYHWLKTSPFCPVCRYELPTDDPVYEQGRKQRMKQRKPRYAKHELQRLTIKQLMAILREQHGGNSRPSYRPVDKRDLMDYLIRSGTIDLVAAPEPVSYALSTLRNMKISKLRETMNEAGVFFDPKDVVEKEDMITIFRNSGRLDVLLEKGSDEGDDHEANSSDNVNGGSETGDSSADGDDAKKVPQPPTVETVADSQSVQMTDERDDKTILMEESS